MRVSVVRGGGFAGLIRTTTADTGRLSPGDRQKLAALVRQARLLDAPTAPASEDNEPDRFTYAVTVEDERGTRTSWFSEPSLPDEVRNLISWISKVDGREESIGPPSGGAKG